VCFARPGALSLRVWKAWVVLQIWVTQLLISPRTEQKIVQGHQITAAEVRDAVVGAVGLPFRWHRDEARGERAIVEVTIRGRTTLVVLYDALSSAGFDGGHQATEAKHGGTTEVPG